MPDDGPAGLPSQHNVQQNSQCINIRTPIRLGEPILFRCCKASLCPMTGQPDYATIYISYVPGERMVESKSLKLYLFSFRNHGDFHEDCVNVIMDDLVKLMDPKYIEVWGKFLPRGGISIDPYCNYGKPGTPWQEVAWQRLSQHDLYPEKINNRG